MLRGGRQGGRLLARRPLQQGDALLRGHVFHVTLMFTTTVCGDCNEPGRRAAQSLGIATWLLDVKTKFMAAMLKYYGRNGTDLNLSQSLFIVCVKIVNITVIFAIGVLTVEQCTFCLLWKRARYWIDMIVV